MSRFDEFRDAGACRARGSFIAAGSAMDALNAISKVLKGVSKSVLFIDPYLDEVILSDFAPLIPQGVQIRLLTDDATIKASLGLRLEDGPHSTAALIRSKLAKRRRECCMTY
jgi:hypothetical protein